MERARRLSLRGRLFLLFGFPARERAALAQTLERLQAALLGCKSGEDAQVDRSVLYVVVNYWAEAAVPTRTRAVRAWRQGAQSAGRVVAVTRFWVLEMARIGRWIDPRADLFFRPPPLPLSAAADAAAGAFAAPLMTYPVDYMDDVDMEMDAQRCEGDGEEKDARRPGGDAKAQSGRPMRLRLPCSPRFTAAQEVPVWPYVFGLLRQPLHSMGDLDAVIRELLRLDSDRRFNCLESAIFQASGLMTREEQQTLFEQALPELAKLVRQLPFVFPSPPALLTPLFASGDAGKASNGPTDAGSGSVGAPSNNASILSSTVTFTKEEALALVGCCFFGIMPDQDRASSSAVDQGGGDSEGERSDRRGRWRRTEPPGVVFPHFSMFRMFISAPASAGPKIHKLRCVLQYFLVATKQLVADRLRLQRDIVTFSRIAIAVPHGASAASTDTDGYDSDDDSDAIAQAIRHRIARLVELPSLDPQRQDRPAPVMLTRIRSETQHLIEDLDAHLQMDFANKYPGGGVLGGGCVQEEIRFVLSPELLVSCLVTAKLEPHEAFAIRGTERYCAYSGYGGSFEMSGPFDDQTPSEDVVHDGRACRRRRCVTVGVDATDYGSDRKGSDRQFSRAHMWRDVLKAFAGFAVGQESASDSDSGTWPVASGNWGCGVFQGDPELKLLLQWLAASLAGRELVYVLLERDLLLKRRLSQLTELMAQLDWKVPVQWLVEFLFRLDDVGSLWAAVSERHRERRKREGLRPRRGGGGVGYGRGGSLGGSASNDGDGGGSGVIAMLIEALERELPGPRTDAERPTAPITDDAPDAVGEQSEDMEIDDGGSADADAAASASTAPAALKKQKKYAQSTMDMFFK